MTVNSEGGKENEERWRSKQEKRGKEIEEGRVVFRLRPAWEG